MKNFTLTCKEIYDLAIAAGFTLDEKERDRPEIDFVEFSLMKCSEDPHPVGFHRTVACMIWPASDGSEHETQIHTLGDRRTL